ncbi:hypothetical protein [Streptomyces griseoaurantiacus]|uniref:hypothetical protein n=1 Tax=Streptomyces griseoaurantiacus TaxID=68213 RepID=UPI00380CEC1D
MPRFYTYDEIVSAETTPANDLLWLATQISALPPFEDGAAVICGSVAWRSPTWRSDIDIALFRTGGHVDIKRDIATLLHAYRESTHGRHPVPRVDVIEIGAESERLVTRENLVTGSMPITTLQTEREVFAATGVRFFDHIGSLAAAKGEPWRSFHTTYLSRVKRDKKTRAKMIREYVTSFTRLWDQQPLRSLVTAPGERPDSEQFQVMGFAENFSTHLMRQILAHRDIYPMPDRTDDVKAAFAQLKSRKFDRIRAALEPFTLITTTYSSLVADCRRSPTNLPKDEYHRRLWEIFCTLPFTEVEEATWQYLSDRNTRRGRRTL